MKTTRLFLLAIASIFVSTFAASTGWTKVSSAPRTVEFDSNQLMMKNADEITSIVRNRINKAQAIQSKQEDTEDGKFLGEPDAIEHIRAALRIVLARPDQDGTRANAFARLRRELIDLDALDATLLDLADEGLRALKNKNTPGKRQLTYIVMLDNLMAEIKPEAKTNPTFGKIIENIRDADLKITSKLKDQALIYAMSVPVSPSETAEKILPKPKKK